MASLNATPEAETVDALADAVATVNLNESEAGETWDALLQDIAKLYGIDPKDTSWEEMIKGADKIRILVTGETGVGKSTLLNGLFGKKFFETGKHKLDPVTLDVDDRKFNEKGVDVIVIDSPGLHDGQGKEKQYVQRMLEVMKAYDGLDLILYCKKMGTTDATVEKEKNIIKHLTQGLGKLQDSNGKYIGKDIWKRSLFVLTFANVYQESLPRQRRTVAAEFQEKTDEWKDFFKKALNECKIYVPVKVCPAGYKDPKLCESEHWLSDFWAASFETQTGNAALALLRLNYHRIVESATPETKNPEDQPIVLTKKVQSALLPNLAKVSAAGVAGAATGAAIGATIGAVGIGVLSFGVAAGAGLAIGGVLGGVVGAAVGGGILKAWQRHKAKKEEQNEAS